MGKLSTSFRTCVCLLLAVTLGCGSDGKGRGSSGKSSAAKPDASKSTDSKKPSVKAKQDTGSSTTVGSKLNHAVLTKSIESGRRFMLQNRTDEGLFRYQFHISNGRSTSSQDDVRQAGGLWGLSLIHRQRPDKETEQALLQSFKYFRDRSVPGPAGGRFVRFPGADAGKTGTVALLGLALYEYLHTGDESKPDEVRQQWLDYVNFIKSLRTVDGTYPGTYDLQSGLGGFESSGYSDGESLLLLAKSADSPECKIDRDQLHKSAAAMYERYVTKPLERHSDPDDTKFFYQWGSMSFFELARLNPSMADRYQTWTIRMARWMIADHKVLHKRLNTGYAMEGMVTAWEMARQQGDINSQKYIGEAIDKGLTKLTSWQVDGPFPSEYLKSLAIHPLASGGILQAEGFEFLRIDVTQHQMHAAILARKYIYQH